MRIKISFGNEGIYNKAEVVKAQIKALAPCSARYIQISIHKLKHGSMNKKKKKIQLFLPCSTNLQTVKCYNKMILSTLSEIQANKRMPRSTDCKGKRRFKESRRLIRQVEQSSPQISIRGAEYLLHGKIKQRDRLPL